LDTNQSINQSIRYVRWTERCVTTSMWNHDDQYLYMHGFTFQHLLPHICHVALLRFTQGVHVGWF